MPRDKFERTKCSCPECSQYCTQVPGMLAVDDVHLIDKHGPDCFNASKGALVAKGNTPFRIPTIVPAMTDGHCVFLDDQGMCGIHEESPYGCSHLDSHIQRKKHTFYHQQTDPVSQLPQN